MEGELMEVLTGQELVSDAAVRLRAAINENIIKKIYKDPVNQNFTRPCIMIHSVEHDSIPQMRDYALWDFTLDFRCHPPKEVTAIHTWARQVAVMVMDAVKILTVGGQQVRASKIESHTIDDVLHVICRYKFRVRQTPTEVPLMETLTYGEKIKSQKG